jgi:hypothetical protein
VYETSFLQCRDNLDLASHITDFDRVEGLEGLDLVSSMADLLLIAGLVGVVV